MFQRRSSAISTLSLGRLGLKLSALRANTLGLELVAISAFMLGLGALSSFMLRLEQFIYIHKGLAGGAGWVMVLKVH
jgi:hypothetical protein